MLEVSQYLIPSYSTQSQKQKQHRHVDEKNRTENPEINLVT